MIYEQEDVWIHQRDACDRVRDAVYDEFDYDGVAVPVAELVGIMMQEIFESCGGKNLYSAYWEGLHEDKILHAIEKKLPQLQEDGEDVDEIAEAAWNGFAEWFEEA